MVIHSWLLQLLVNGKGPFCAYLSLSLSYSLVSLAATLDRSDLKHPPSDLIFSPLLNTFRPLHHTAGCQCFVPLDGLTQQVGIYKFCFDERFVNIILHPIFKQVSETTVKSRYHSFQRGFRMQGLSRTRCGFPFEETCQRHRMGIFFSSFLKIRSYH
jgi:hypothetical protein